MHARPRMDPGAGYVQAGKGAAAPAQRRRRAKDQLLVGFAATAGKIPASHAWVLSFDHVRRTDAAAAHELAEAGRKALQLPLDRRGDFVIPDRRTLRNASVDIQRLLAVRRSCRVVQRLLTDDERRAVGQMAVRGLLE